MGRWFGQRFVYVLIAALLLAQQGVALHGLSHGVEALRIAKQEQPDPRSLPTDRHCDLCLAYAQVAAGAAPAAPLFEAPTLEYAAPLAVSFATRAPVGRAYQSRAPPRIA